MATDGFSATINFAIKIPPFCFGLQYVRRQNAALKSDGFGVLLVRGFVLVRHIGGDLKIALVFGVVCIGVKGFFCGSAASARLWLSRCGGRQDRFWVGSWHHAPLQVYDIVHRNKKMAASDVRKNRGKSYAAGKDKEKAVPRR